MSQKKPMRVVIVEDPHKYEGIDSEVVIAIVLLILIIVTGL